MPPVEVPTIKSKHSAADLPTCFSIREITTAGIMPRIPPHQSPICVVPRLPCFAMIKMSAGITASILRKRNIAGRQIHIGALNSGRYFDVDTHSFLINRVAVFYSPLSSCSGRDLNFFSKLLYIFVIILTVMRSLSLCQKLHYLEFVNLKPPPEK